MAQKAIREADGKRMMARLLGDYIKGYKLDDKYVTVGPDTDLKKLPNKYKWLKKERLVVKPDQLIKRRGKSKLLLLNATWNQAEKWLKQRVNKKLTVGKTTGVLTHFIVEPFIKHADKDEYYVALRHAQAALDADPGQVVAWLRFFLRCLVRQIEVLGRKLETERLMAPLAPLGEALLEIVREHGRVTVRDAVRITGANRNTVKDHLRRLVADGILAARGRGRGTWDEAS